MGSMQVSVEALGPKGKKEPFLGRGQGKAGWVCVCGVVCLQYRWGKKTGPWRVKRVYNATKEHFQAWQWWRQAFTPSV